MAVYATMPLGWLLIFLLLLKRGIRVINVGEYNEKLEPWCLGSGMYHSAAAEKRELDGSSKSYTCFYCMTYEFSFWVCTLKICKD